jgi:hypothetical protein
MNSSRIRDLALAAQIDEGQLAWRRQVAPITERFAREISRRDCRGKRLAYSGHITFQNAIPMMTALREAGVEIAAGACNVDRTDDAVAVYLAAKGMSVYGWRGMSRRCESRHERGNRMFRKVLKYQVDWDLVKHVGFMIFQLEGEVGLPQVAVSDAAEFHTVIDLLRNERPVYYDRDTKHLQTLLEPVGEGEPAR